MTDRKYFDILDQHAIRCICNHLQLYDLINLKRSSRRLNTIISKFLSDVSFKKAFILQQEIMVHNEIIHTNLKQRELYTILHKLNEYKDTHKLEIKPDGYMSRNATTWLYCSVEYATSFYNYSINEYIVYVKSNQPDKRYQKIITKMSNMGFKRVFLPKAIKEYKDVRMMFTKKGCILYKTFHNCPICKKDHPIQDCDKAVCNICNTVGHLTQRCPFTVCKICKKTGKHLTSRCPQIKCKKCKKKGHIAKRCLKIK